MTGFSLKSLQYYAKRNEIHTTESTVHHSSPGAPNIELPPLPEDDFAKEEFQKTQDPEEDWEDLEPDSKSDDRTTKPKRRKYQVSAHRATFPYIF